MLLKRNEVAAATEKITTTRRKQGERTITPVQTASATVQLTKTPTTTCRGRKWELPYTTDST